MLTSILINKPFYWLTLTILFIQHVSGGGGEKTSCHLYGHSCLGAHGKRSNELSQSIDSKLIPQDMDKYSYQIPNLETQIINNRIFNRLLSYIKNSNGQASSSSTTSPGLNTISYLDSLNPAVLAQLNQINALDQQFQNQQSLKSKRIESAKSNYDDQHTYRNFFKKSNDFLNRQKDIKRTNELDEYSEFY